MTPRSGDPIFLRPRAIAPIAALICALAIGGVGAAEATAQSQAGVTATASSTVLKKGKRGKRVRALQRKLGLAADGVFGKQTKRAVRRYQRRHGLVADGIAGPQTLASLGISATGSGRKARGSHRSRSHSRSGRGVRSLQRKLGLAADGVFGPNTERAVRRFQRSRGLTADGVVGPQTRSVLGLAPGGVLERKRSGRGGGGGNGTIARLIAAGNRIARKPYRYGGGHGSYRDSGYDCSGSVSYALHGAGLLRTPLDSSDLMSYGRPGRGRRITIYANSGHAYMVVDGRRFDTSAVRETGSRWTSTHRSPAGYVARHPAGF